MAETQSGPTKFVQIRGSDYLYRIIQKIGNQYMTDFPSVGLPLIKGGSLDTYKSIIDGTADIGLVSTDMPEDLHKWAKNQKVDYTSTLIAYDAIDAIVHPSNPIKNLSLIDLRAIYSGKILSWKELGWTAGGEIKVYSQEHVSGTYVAWKKLVMGEKVHITLSAEIFNEDKKVANEVAKNKHAIGYLSSIVAIDEKSNRLSINNIFPTVEAISKNNYPICRGLKLLSRSHSGSEVKHFIQYCLSPDKGQLIIQQMGLAGIG